MAESDTSPLDALIPESFELESIDLVLIGVLAGMTAILDFIGVVAFPIGYGVSGFYVGAAFYCAFAIWFRWRALIALYVGLLIGAIITGQFNVFTFLLAWSNVVGAALVMVIFHVGRLDQALSSARDYAGLGASALAYAVASSSYFFGLNLALGLIPPEAVLPGMSGWIIGNVVVILLIGSLLLKTVTPVVGQMSFYSRPA